MPHTHSCRLTQLVNIYYYNYNYHYNYIYLNPSFRAKPMPMPSLCYTLLSSTLLYLHHISNPTTFITILYSTHWLHSDPVQSQSSPSPVPFPVQSHPCSTNNEYSQLGTYLPTVPMIPTSLARHVTNNVLLGPLSLGGGSAVQSGAEQSRAGQDTETLLCFAPFLTYSTLPPPPPL